MIHFKDITSVVSDLSYSAPKLQVSSEPLLLNVTEEFGKDYVTRTMHLDGKSIYFKTKSDVDIPPLQNWDFAVLASVFTAMRKRQPLHVCGPVSKSLLRNLEDFQEVWAIWLPDLYAIIPITADHEIDSTPTSNKNGVFAFSGGLDSSFTLLRHQIKDAGRRTVTPKAAVLINGFDLSLSNPHAIEVASKSAQAILDQMDIQLSTVETNWKTDLCHNWRMEHMTGIVACLSQFQGVADIAMIGSDGGGDHLDIPWGSNMFTNPYLSSDAMKVYTEGAGFSRSERIAYVLKHSNLAPHIRVCWENAQTGANCGNCEKCIRTQLNFRSVGVEPQGYKKIAGFWRIATIPTKSIGDNYYLGEIQKVASENKIRAWWRVACYISMVKNVISTPFLMLKNRIRNYIRKNEKLYQRVKGLVKKDA